MLIEALCGQLAIVSNDCPHGPKEILANGCYGLLVDNENPQALAEGISQALSQAQPSSAAKMLERAQEFSVNRAVFNWEKTLDGIHEK